jgi:hypothetical protein
MFVEMKNVTVVLDEEVARWARVKAAQENTSVSRLVGVILRREMQEEDAYATAMQYFLSREPTPLKRGGKYPARESLYGRGRVR